MSKFECRAKVYHISLHSSYISDFTATFSIQRIFGHTSSCSALKEFTQSKANNYDICWFPCCENHTVSQF